MSVEDKRTRDAQEAPHSPNPSMEYYRQFVDRSLASTESMLHREAFEKGVLRGATKALADVLVRGLMLHLGGLDPAVRERIRSEKDLETLDVWCAALRGIRSAEEAAQLVTKIMNARGR
ncbi:MAG: hypothetical protein R3B70_27320 [Polyangiaceae bacterium]